MEANELRINNYYKLKGSVLDGGICQLKNLNDFIHIGNLIKNDLVKPIPLTEEWLLKFGVEKKYGCFLLSTNRGTIQIEEDLAEISSVITHNGFMAPCKYVHQLQNLYFSLTGTELEIKQ